MPLRISVKETQLKVGFWWKKNDVYFDGCSCHMAHNAAVNEEISFLELLDLMLRI